MPRYKIAVMGGDGIGPEVVRAGVQALKVCAERDGRFALDFQDFDWGSDYYRTHGVMMPAGGADQLRKFDAILFGAVGSPESACRRPPRQRARKTTAARPGSVIDALFLAGMA